MSGRATHKIRLIHLYTEKFPCVWCAGFAMNYPFLVTVMQVAGLVLLAGCAIGLLRLITIHFIQHDWTREQARSLLPLTALQSAGLLVFAFSAGGILAIRFFETNELPPLPLFAAQVALMAVLAAGTVFLHVVARPWLCEFDTETEDDAPLVMRLGIHRLIAMTLAFAAFASAWVLWVVMAWPDAAAPPANQLLSAFAITTLVLWALLAVPAVVLRGAALYYTGDYSLESSMWRPVTTASRLPMPWRQTSRRAAPCRCCRTCHSTNLSMCRRRARHARR